ncbi:MAG TPA: rod shape-determining protein MreC [Acidobacteriaceae bacterium]|jgi:rod shape-determining protein MreC|nr:rod shape-determining protein MreC [Acidobacteriaceae bacterium]
MDSFFFRFKNALVLIAIVLVQVLALAVQVQRPVEGDLPGAPPGAAPDGQKITLLRRWSVALVTPVERVVHGASLHTRNLWSNYLYLRGAREQNQELRAEVARLREEQAAFAEDAAQGRRLQAVLGFQQQYITKTVAAQVIGTSGSDRSHLLYLDKGSNDGLRSNQAVITPYGIVGKLRDVFPHTSQLLLINDSNSGAGVVLQSSRIRAIVRGSAVGQVEITNLTADDRIKPGETVVTSGGDQVFPRGLPVGTIQTVTPDPQHQPYTSIVLKPAADLNRLEEVLVVTGSTTGLPPGAQADAAQAEETAAAEASKRAADVLAQRLPSLQEPPPAPAGGSAKPAAAADGKPPADSDEVGGVPGVPSSGLPKVRPALHPDRYSPGATPSAAELRPGAPATPQTGTFTADPAAAPAPAASPRASQPSSSTGRPAANSTPTSTSSPSASRPRSPAASASDGQSRPSEPRPARARTAPAQPHPAIPLFPDSPEPAQTPQPQ